jgi:hypothetical protein
MSNAGEAVGGCAAWKPPGKPIKKERGKCAGQSRSRRARQRYRLAAFIHDGQAGWGERPDLRKYPVQKAEGKKQKGCRQINPSAQVDD